MEEVRTRGVPLPSSPPAAHVVSTTGSRVYAHVFCSWAAILWKSMTRTVMLSRLPRSKASLASTSHPCRESAFTLATLAISVHRVHLINKVLIESKQMQVGEKICQLYYLHWSDLPASAATASSLVCVSQRPSVARTA